MRPALPRSLPSTISRGDPIKSEAIKIAASEAEDLARRLAERISHDYGEGATVDRIVLVASVTEEDGSQRAVVAAGDGLPLYAQAGTLRRVLSTITAS